MSKYNDESRFLLSPKENASKRVHRDHKQKQQDNNPGNAGLAKERVWYAKDVAKIAETFKVHTNTGLSDKQIKHRLKHYGRNALPEAPPPSLFKIIWRQLTDFMVLILLAAGIASLAIQDWIEAVVLFAVVITNVVIGVVEEWKAEKKLAELKELTVPTATVLRHGDKEVVQAADVVLGDIVLLEEGARIPADLRLIEAVNLQIIESMLTGESEPVDKTGETLPRENLNLGDRKNLAFMATNVVRGRGKGIVVATGRQTEIGKISKVLVDPGEEKTHLQLHLKKLGKILVVLSIILCALVVGVGFLRRYLDTGKITREDVIGLIKVGVSLAVSVIPEGLVAVVTVTMAFGVSRMAKRHAVVRKLPAVETLGSVTTICADKTGTLTEGIMKAQELWVAGESYQISGQGNAPEGSLSRNGEEMDNPEAFPEPLQQALKVLSLCNNAEIQKEEIEEEWEAIGDPTEVALLVAAYKGSMSKEDLLQDHTFLHEAPFDSTRNRMTVVYSLAEGDEAVALSKGAPTTLMNYCTSAYWGNNVVDINEELTHIIERKSEQLASSGLRVLALAYRPLTSENRKRLTRGEDAEKELTFLGLVGLFDPPRKGVREAIKVCRDCGIRVHMITGDHPLTAKCIASRLGIIQPDDDDQVMKGSDLDNLSTKQIAEMRQIPSVFARVSPENKQKIVKALKIRGEVVAMTGDGVNDAPAIKQANVAVAMGSGTDLTKQVADVVLTDNNFTSIVDAIEEGRRIYDNIQKFILYLLSCNSSEIYIMLVAVAAGLPVPFTPVMILWANLIVDIPPALALGIDPVSRDALHRKPRKPNTGIFTWKSFLIILFQGLSMSGLTLGIYTIAIYVEQYKTPIDYERPSHAKGLAFVTLAVIQLIHAFLSRSPREFSFNRDFFNNKWLLLGVGGSIALLVMASYIPGVKHVLNQYPLNWFDWVKVGICVLIHIILVEVCKFVIRLTSNKNKLDRSRSEQEELFYEDV